MKTDVQILRYIEGFPGQSVPLDDLRAYIGEGAAAKISEMERGKLLRRTAAGYWDSTKAMYGVGPAGADMLSAARQDEERYISTRRRSTVALIVSIAALGLSFVSLLLQWIYIYSRH